MGGEPEPKESLKRKIGDDIELAKLKAQELAARLNVDAETKRARLEPSYATPVTPSDAFSQPSFYDSTQSYQSRSNSYSSYGSAPTSRKISIPNDKVGVVIGKGGDTIKSLQLQSGARIQIAKDADASSMASREVDLVGTAEQMSRAEELINNLLAEVDADVSASGGVKSGPTGGDQIVMKVPDNRVALLIGKGGETIKTIQSRSGARMQIVPLRPPPNEILTERSVFINGNQQQIDSAQEMVNEIVREGRLRIPPSSSAYFQPAYTAPASWVPPGQTPHQPYQSGYEYSIPGAHPSHSSYYGEYGTNPQAGWDQPNPTPVPPPQQSTGYNYYGQAEQTGLAPPAYNYGYGQPPTPVPSQSGSLGYPPQPAAYGQTYPGQPPAPVPSQSGSQGYPSQPAAYGQNYPGQPLSVNQQNAYPTFGSAAAQPTYAPPPNPVVYSQGAATQVGYTAPPTSLPPYGTSHGYSVPPTSQPVYGTSYPVSSQSAYGVQQGYSVPPTYNEAGYGGQQHPSKPPPPSSAIPPPYAQSAYPSAAYEQSQPSQPQPAQAHASKPISDGNATQVKDSFPPVQTTPNSSSRAA